MVGVKYLSFLGVIREVREVKEISEFRERAEEYEPSGGVEELWERGICAEWGRGGTVGGGIRAEWGEEERGE